MTLDLWRIRYKDGIKAADSRLVWATTKESAEALGAAWCEPRGFRYVGVECETVAREGQAPGVVKPIPPPVSDKLPPAALYVAALK